MNSSTKVSYAFCVVGTKSFEGAGKNRRVMLLTIFSYSYKSAFCTRAREARITAFFFNARLARARFPAVDLRGRVGAVEEAAEGGEVHADCEPAGAQGGRKIVCFL